MVAIKESPLINLQSPSGEKKKKKKERGVFGWYVTFLYIQFKKIGGFKSRYFCLKFKNSIVGKMHAKEIAENGLALQLTIMHTDSILG